MNRTPLMRASDLVALTLIEQEIREENARYDAKHRGADQDSEMTVADYLDRIGIQCERMMTPSSAEHRARLIKIVAIAMRAAEALDRKETRQ